MSATCSDSKCFIELAQKYGANNYHPLDIVISKASGVWVEDPEGKRYMDMLSAYSALNHGHRHPKVIAALVEQGGRVTLTSRAFHNDQLGPWLKELCEFSGYEMALPMNTGAEAVETAIKAARKWGYDVKKIPDTKAEIIVCENNFHGRTTTISGFSTEELYKKGFGPFTPGFKVIPYGDIEAFKNAITSDTCAFMFEPIQGEAGVLIPPEGCLKEAQRICKENNVLYIADEIQTGFGRTGKLFACEHENVKPDIMILGKALGGGVMPISAVVASKEVLDVFTPGSHGSTFGGNPLACAVSRTAMCVLIDEKLTENSAKLGDYLMNKLKTLENPLIKEVRGRGLFVGVELKPEAGGARKYCEQLKEECILCKETHENVIRFAPPLIITAKDLDWAFERVKKVIG